VASNLLEVFAGCRGLGVEEWTRLAGLASSLAEEFAGHVGGRAAGLQRQRVRFLGQSSEVQLTQKEDFLLQRSRAGYLAGHSQRGREGRRALA
jgi:hypothetical protein